MIKAQEEMQTQYEEDRAATARSVENEWRMAERKHQDEMRKEFHELKMIRIRYGCEENVVMSAKRDNHRLRKEMTTMKDAENEQIKRNAYVHQRGR